MLGSLLAAKQILQRVGLHEVALENREQRKSLETSSAGPGLCDIVQQRRVSPAWLQ